MKTTTIIFKTFSKTFPKAFVTLYQFLFVIVFCLISINEKQFFAIDSAEAGENYRIYNAPIDITPLNRGGPSSLRHPALDRKRSDAQMFKQKQEELDRKRREREEREERDRQERERRAREEEARSREIEKQELRKKYLKELFEGDKSLHQPPGHRQLEIDLANHRESLLFNGRKEMKWTPSQDRFFPFLSYTEQCQISG